MRFETFEPRIVFDQALGAAIEFQIDTSVELEPVQEPVLTHLPSDIQFRSTSDDFRYESANLEPEILDDLVLATEAWADDPRPWRTFKLSDTDAWRKSFNTNPISVHDDGYIIAERVEAQADAHTLLTVQKPNNDCHLHGGLFLRPDYHYRYSFDIRHPESELSWLHEADGNWAIVTQLWGPREDEEPFLEPPFSIYTYVDEGTPYWTVRNIGDSKKTTPPYQVEFDERVRVPLVNVGDWHHWDIEYVPNAYGQGMVKAWLNGELVFEFIDVKSSYNASIGGVTTGPMNPSFGLYSYSVADGQEAHFDNIVVQCSGEFQSSISGRVTGSSIPEGTAVFAANTLTGERYGTYTEKNGVYVLAVPKGPYTITAVHESTGQVGTVENVSTLTASNRTADVTLSSVPAPIPPVVEPPVLTVTGDVNGDGHSDIINRLADGSWQVSVVNSQDGVSAQSTVQGLAADPVSTSVWTTWSNTANWTDIHVADFNGDGLDDIAGRAEQGTWWIAESTGTGFVNRYWGTWTTGLDWLNVSVGDFNGDGMADIAGRAATNGSWWISMSTGTEFRNTPFGRWTTSIDWDMVVGDFNGDGLDDIAGRASSDGTWWVGESNGSRFENQFWGKFAQVEWGEFLVGDFNGDGLSDIAARTESDGGFWVAESTGQGFNNRYWGRWLDTISWLDVNVADVDGDGNADLVGRADKDGSWWIAKSNGNRFQNQYWGQVWSQDVDWLTAVIDDFDGDGRADLLGVNSEKWWLSV